MAETQDIWALIEARVKAMEPFYGQIDKTRKRLNLTPFAMKTFDGKNNLGSVINVTENRSATYMARIIAGLMSSKWQGVIEGDISKQAAHKIEEFLENNRQQADEFMLNEYGIASLDAWLCNHVCHTSLIGVRWMSKVEEGKYEVDCLPLDMRWTPFVLNRWAAPITFRSKEDLVQELEGFKETAANNEGFFFQMPAELKDTNNECRDYWDTEKNELWIEKQLVFQQPNPYGKLPFIFVYPPSGFMFRDKGFMEHESPGLLYLNEGLYDQLSRQLSIDATLGFDPVLPAYQRPVKNPVSDAISMPPPQRGESLDVPDGELFQLVPRPDINQAQIASRVEVTKLMDDAGPMTPRAYTTPPSAVEVVTEVELLDELQNPRYIALQMFREQLARLIIDQFIFVCGETTEPIKVGKRGRLKSFNVANLKDPDSYSISYQLMKQNKRLAIVNEARALAAWGRFPTSYIFKDILMVEDPAGWERALDLQQAKEADPALALFEMGVKYAEEAEEMSDENDADLKKFQAMMLIERGIAMVKARMNPQPQPLSEETREPKVPLEKGSANALIPLLGRGGGIV